jgi:hypothetical protein
MVANGRAGSPIPYAPALRSFPSPPHRRHSISRAHSLLMPTRRKPATSASNKPGDDAQAPRTGATEDDAEAAEPEIDDPDIEVAAADDDAVDEDDAVAVVADDDDDHDDIDEDDVVAVVAKPAPARPAARPSPGRPPSAKEEPEPPFNVGERVRLIQNTRPRTGTPIGDYPVGSEGRVETVLSQTAIIRFDRASDTKEVVAFVCLESIDEEAKAGRAAREREKQREEAAAAEERDRSTRKESS